MPKKKPKLLFKNHTEKVEIVSVSREKLCHTILHSISKFCHTLPPSPPVFSSPILREEEEEEEEEGDSNRKKKKSRSSRPLPILSRCLQNGTWTPVSLVCVRDPSVPDPLGDIR